MYQDVGGILRCFVGVSLGVAPSDDGSISLTSDGGDVSVDDCCFVSNWSYYCSCCASSALRASSPV